MLLTVGKEEVKAMEKVLSASVLRSSRGGELGGWGSLGKGGGN